VELTFVYGHSKSSFSTMINNIKQTINYNLYYTDELIGNIKRKNLSVTKYGNSIYSNLFYCDNENKICISFTPRGGCSISFQQYLD